jgi:hypothetical protein
MGTFILALGTPERRPQTLANGDIPSAATLHACLKLGVIQILAKLPHVSGQVV